MAAQGERVSRAIGLCSLVDAPMAQDEIPEQDIVVEEQELPQMDPEPEMGTVAAAAYDTSPPLPRQNPSPAPSETTTDRGDSASSGSAEINRVGGNVDADDARNER